MWRPACRRRWTDLGAGFYFAGVFVTLVNWFVVLPIKGAPIGGGFRMPGVVVVPLVYAFWGFGMWMIFGLARRALGGRTWNR
jgi:hypothetical protein